MIENKADMDALGHLTIAILRVLMSKGLVDKDDITADLARQGVTAEEAFVLSRLIDSLPKR